MNLNIGKNIKEMRNKRGLSQEKLAEYLKVSPQSISKWERCDGYPDILFLIPLADFFGVSLDTLMGRDAQNREMQIKDVIARLEHYRHIGDHTAKNALAREAYREYPYDFRIISWYIVALMDTADPNGVKQEVEELCQYILQECTEDYLRYDAMTSLASLYGDCGDYDKAEALVSRLPELNDCRHAMRCQIYPSGDERDFHAMADFVDRGSELLLWFLCQIAVYRNGLTVRERIDVLKGACDVGHAIFPDGDFCVCHSVMADIYISLYRYYSEEGNYEAALNALEQCFAHEKALDDLVNDEVVHTSPALRGHAFDMRTTWDGCQCNGVYWVFERLSEPRFTFAHYAEDAAYRALLEAYRPYAVEDKTDEKNEP
ncbi:MAG: helix-turn-helix transcriptional regulator [Clostridia bacterium]|nr:helix-turn-helix transcriptional regulator [Clostridia bacterium]